MSGEPGIERIERPLNAAEKRWLRLHLLRVDCRRVRWRRWVAASLVVFVPIWVLALFSRVGPPRIVSVFVVALAFAVNVGAAADERRRNRRRREAASSALEHDRVIETRIRAHDLLRIAALDDTGDCWLFDVGPQATLVLQGQRYDEDLRFPATGFSLVEIRQNEDRALTERIVTRGSKLSPRRTFPASAKAALGLDGELTIIPRSLRELEPTL